MARPTPKKTPELSSSAATPKAGAKAVQYKPTRSWYSPTVFKANLAEEQNGGKTLPLYALVGEDALAPYVWISLLGDRPLTTSSSPSPLRRGLKSILIKNEYNKFPNVEIELYVPEYRQGHGDANKARLEQSSRALKVLRVGAEFNLNWGYSRAHTTWGPLTIYERQIEFGQGTALLLIKAKIGSRLSSTVTSQVFSTTNDRSAAEQVAAAGGHRLNTAQISQESLKRLNSLTTEIVTANTNMAQTVARQANKADVDVVISPDTSEVILSPPFKLDLLKRGSKIAKMTYGFPTSQIASIDVETKKPKKSGTGRRSSKGVRFKGTGISTKSKTGRVLVKGTISVYSKEGEFQRYLHFGYSGQGASSSSLPHITAMKNQSLFSTEGTSASAKANAVSNAQKVWKPQNGFQIEINDQIVDVPATAGFKHVLVYKVTRVKGNVELDNDGLSLFNLAEDAASKKDVVDRYWKTQQQINDLTKQAERGEIIFTVTSNNPQLGTDNVERFPVKIYKPKAQAKQTPVGDQVNESSTFYTVLSTLHDLTGGGSTYPEKTVSLEGDEYVDSEISSVTLDAAQWRTFNALSAAKKQQFLNTNDPGTGGAPITDLYKQSIKDFIHQKNILEDRAKRMGNKARVFVRINNDKAILVYAERPDVVVPDAPRRARGVAVVAPVTASADGELRPTFELASTASGTPRASRRLSLVTLTLRLKAGDWTMRVGRLIELVDVYESINGVYYIHAEEHSISDNGFHTTLTCKKAAKSDINAGVVKDKGTRRNSTQTPKPKEEGLPTSITESPTQKTARNHVEDINVEGRRRRDEERFSFKPEIGL